jgi:hypothetical protein
MNSTVWHLQYIINCNTTMSRHKASIYLSIFYSVINISSYSRKINKINKQKTKRKRKKKKTKQNKTYQWKHAIIKSSEY